MSNITASKIIDKTKASEDLNRALFYSWVKNVKDERQKLATKRFLNGIGYSESELKKLSSSKDLDPVSQAFLASLGIGKSTVRKIASHRTR